MLKIKFLFLVSASLAMVTAANADDGKGGKDGNKPGAEISSAISWDEMKARCLHPEQFDVQRAPQNIKVQCGDSTYDYVPAAPGSFALASSRTVVTSVLADKFHVVAGALDIPVVQKGGNCLRFKEVERSLTIERPMSCDEIVGMKGDPAEYCVSSLDYAKGTNPKLLQVRDTGRVVDTCGVLVQGGDGKGNGK